MKGLILLNQADGQHLAAEMILRYYYEKLEANVTVKDLNGVSTGDATTYIGTLTNLDYDKIHICVTVDTSGGTGKLSHDQVASLLPKLKVAALPTPVLESAHAAHNTTVTDIILTSPASALADTYNGMIIAVDVGDTGTASLWRYIKDYTVSDYTCKVNTTSTAVTDEDSYVVYNPINALEGPICIYTSATAGHLVFASVYPHMALPKLIDELRAATAEYVLTNTATSVANSSGVGILTHTGNFTLNAYTGGDYYVGIRSSTTGAGQIRKIVSNTANVLTLDAPWDPVPTGTVVYEIVYNRWRCLNDYFLKFGIRYKFMPPYTLAKLDEFLKLLDVNADFTHTTKYTFQDLEALEALHDLGETIMVTLGKGITS